VKTAGRQDGRTAPERVRALLRAVLPACRLAVLFAVLPSCRLVAQARLQVPQAVQERDPTTALDNAAIVKAIEHKIKCTCGCNLDVFTCRTTDFTCTTSPAMHRVVMARLDSGMTADQVVAAFEAQYGQSVLMQPPRRGFNWSAYIMPFVGLGFGLALVFALMRRWIRTAGRQDGKTASEGGELAGVPSGQPASSEDVERLKRELERFET
jgi:cytochrome c-type biogenesis protein CcmH